VLDGESDMSEQSIEAPPPSWDALCLCVHAADWCSLVQTHDKTQCVVSRTQSAPRKLSEGEAPINSTQAARLQQRRFEAAENRAVQRTPLIWALSWSLRNARNHNALASHR